MSLHRKVITRRKDNGEGFVGQKSQLPGVTVPGTQKGDEPQARQRRIYELYDKPGYRQFDS